MLNINFEKCTGCGACLQKCPKKCITWQEKEFGFKYPYIDKVNCINCKLCEEVCPIEKENIIGFTQKAFAVINKSRDILLDSSSGGMFTSAAKKILSSNGAVYGCLLENFVAKHVRITSIDQLPKIRGSKYIQSDTKSTFSQVEKDLKENKNVLYVGTPCQIAGLNAFLGQEYPRLLTADIVCHGVGSQKYFDRYIEWVKLENGKIEELKFRDKEFGKALIGCGVGSITVKGKRGLVKRPLYAFMSYYYKYFLKGDIYRNSCYVCKYANLNRPADITMGDFWGVEKLKLPLTINLGCSLLIINSRKGEKFVESLEDIDKVSVPIKDAIRGNNQLSHPSILNPERNFRIQEYDKYSGGQITKIFYKKYKREIIKDKIKSKIPLSLQITIKKIKK